MRRNRVIAGIVFFIAASLAVAFFLRTPRDRHSIFDATVDDVGYRPFAGRLSASSWAPFQREKARSSGTELSLASAAAKLRGSPEEDARAIGSLLAGDARDAVRRLRALVSRRSSARVWNDLAVAQQALAGDDVEILCDALAAAERALDLEPRLEEAHFNRAVILDSLSLSQAAAHAYAAFLSLDTSSAWAVEARGRLNELRSRVTKRQAWRDRIPELRRAVAANDGRTIAAAVTAAPQEARTWAETEFLGDWADASVAGDDAAGFAHLALAREIGHALHGRGESLLNDAVAIIDEASRKDRARLSALAHAHALYRKSRRQYHARDAARALSGFREAFQLFEQAGSPMALIVEYYIGNAAIDTGDRKAALAASADIARRAPFRYASLRALNDWLRGALYGVDMLYDDMLRQYENAHRQFAALGEQQNATNMLDLMAATQSVLGRTDQAWQLRRQTFPIADSSGIPQRLEIALLGAANDAARAQKWDVARALLGLTMKVEGGNLRLQAEASAWRTLAANRAGMRAVDDLNVARRTAMKIPDAELRSDAEGEVLLIEALLARDDPARAVSLLTRYIGRIVDRAAAHRLPRALEERASALKSMQRFVEARTDLERAIALIEQQRESIVREDLRDSFLGIAGSAYDQLADLLDAHGDTIGAMAASDRRRARTILDRIDAQRPASFILDANFLRRIPDDVAILTYGRFDSRTVIYACTAEGIDRHEVATTRAQLDELALAFVHAVARGTEAHARDAARRMYTTLIGPAYATVQHRSSLVFVVDGDLQRIPLSALMMDDRSYLVEHFSVSVAPSVAGFVNAYTTTPDPPASVVAVGNPTLDANRFPDLSSLHGAEDEAYSVASIYSRSVLLTRSEATAAAVRNALAASEIADIATHAVVNDRDPRKSQLLLAPDGREDGVLTTADIAAMRLRTRVVVLAGCKTAVSGSGYGDVRNLAAAFLAAGSRSIVASLWDIEDTAARDLSVAFHRELRNGTAPAEALRTAQLHLLQSGNPRAREPRAWAALQVYGFGH